MSTSIGSCVAELGGGINGCTSRGRRRPLAEITNFTKQIVQSDVDTDDSLQQTLLIYRQTHRHYDAWNNRQNEPIVRTSAQEGYLLVFTTNVKHAIMWKFFIKNAVGDDSVGVKYASKTSLLNADGRTSITSNQI